MYLENVIVMGAGNFLFNIINDIEKKYNVLCILDNNLEKQGTFFYEKYKIISPFNMQEYKYDKIIIASFVYKNEFINQLEKLGVAMEKISLEYLYKYATISIRDLFLCQFTENGIFNRFDIIVRYLAIENYYGKNDFGFKLYNKMQLKRLKQEDNKCEETFRNLIKSYEEKGYEMTSYIECDNEFNLFDGSHRLSLNIYHDIENINVRVIAFSPDINYGIDWFYDNGFSDEDINIIKVKYNEIIKKIQRCFIGVLWPASQYYFDDIICDLKEQKLLESYQDIKVNYNDVKLLTKMIYGIDDIENWKIEEKLKMFGDFDEGVIRVIKLNVLQPDYRMKLHSSKPLSRKMEQLKKIIRETYKEKIDNYFEDIISHIADNLEQSIFIEKCIDIYNLEYLKEDYKVTKVVEERLNNLIKYCDDNNISKNDVCVVGSSILELYGIRNSNDLDVLVKHKDIEKFSSASLFDIKEKYFVLNNKVIVSDDEIINNSEYTFKVKDIKFLDLKLLCYKKLLAGRKNDKADLKLVLQVKK